MSIPFKVDFLGKKTPAWLCNLNNSLWNILGGKNFVTRYIPEGNKWILQTVKLSNKLEQEVTTLLKNVIPQNITVEYDPFPLDYTRLEYLESTGTQWLDTGYIPQYEEYSAEANFASNLKLGTYEIFWGICNVSIGDYRTGLSHFGAGERLTIEKLRWYHYKDELVEFYADFHTIKYVTKINDTEKPRLFIDGDAIAEDRIIATAYDYAPNGEPNTLSFYLFARNQNTGTTYAPSKTKMKYAAFYEGSVKKFYGIPCINKDGELGMFDTVSGTFRPNIGTGKFIAGVDTLAQLYSLLARLPDKTGQDVAEPLQIRLAAALQTDELRAMIDERGEAKNWEISEAT